MARLDWVLPCAKPPCWPFRRAGWPLSVHPVANRSRPNSHSECLAQSLLYGGSPLNCDSNAPWHVPHLLNGRRLHGETEKRLEHVTNPARECCIRRGDCKHLPS
jgi:hypothetical protein